MQEEQYKIIAQLRMERASELLQEAETLLAMKAYKSANNRAYYSIEKSLNALLAIAGTQTQTHTGCLKQFNMLYVHNGDGYFTRDDYKIASSAEHIRNSSDYDDFYIADKNETGELVRNAKILYEKTKKYMENKHNKSDSE